MQFLYLADSLEKPGSVEFNCTKNIGEFYAKRAGGVYRIHRVDANSKDTMLGRMEGLCSEIEAELQKDMRLRHNVEDLIDIFDRVCIWENPENLALTCEILKKEKEDLRKRNEFLEEENSRLTELLNLEGY